MDAECSVCSQNGTLPDQGRVSELEMAAFVIQRINLAVALFGIATNFLNILVFSRTGIRNNVTTISVFALSISDLGFVFLYACSRILLVLEEFGLRSAIPLAYTGFLVLVYSLLPYNVSVVFTVFLAFQKCYCVAMPLRFKNDITPRKTVTTLVISALVTIALFSPPMTALGWTTIQNPLTNTTFIVPWVSEHRDVLNSYYTMTFFNTLPLISQISVICCVVVLAFNLRKASRFRQSSKSQDGDPVKANQLTGKELRAVQSVTVVAVMFITCNMPHMVVAYGSLIQPEFTDQGRLAELFSLVSSIKMILLVMCSTLNLFVYVNYNVAFRKELKRLLNHFSKNEV